MAHARTFSFTDEAVNVAFPAVSRRGSQSESQMSASRPIAGPQSADPALLLFQLRRAQSFWYQALYQSDPTPLPNPTSFLWQMCLDMREWNESLPSTLPSGMRQLFEQELRYSYVYCLSPSVRVPQITDYIRVLIFEYSLDYLNNMYDIAYSGLNIAFYTYHDALKVFFMANQFLAVLRDAQDLLLSGAQVSPPATQPGSAPAPPIPRRQFRPGLPVDSNLDRSIWCLERTPKTLELYGVRWEDAMVLKQSFEQMSSSTLQQLRNLRQMAGAQLGPGPVHGPVHGQVQYPNGMQPVPQPSVVPMANQGQPATNMRWVGVNAAQMMHGGPRQ